MAVVEPRVEQERVLLEWVAPARPYRNKKTQLLSVPLVIVILVGIILLVSMEWMLIIVLAALVFAYYAWSMVPMEWMLIIVLAALVFAYYAWSMVPPENVDYKITTLGVRVGLQLYDWHQMVRWWMSENWGHKVLMIDSMQAVLGRLVLPLGEMSSEKVEGLMEKMLLKETPPETAVDKAGKWISEKFPLEESVKI